MLRRLEGVAVGSTLALSLGLELDEAEVELEDWGTGCSEDFFVLCLLDLGLSSRAMVLVLDPALHVSTANKPDSPPFFFFLGAEDDLGDVVVEAVVGAAVATPGDVVWLVVGGAIGATGGCDARRVAGEREGESRLRLGPGERREGEAR